MKRSPLRSIGRRKKAKRSDRAMTVSIVHHRDQTCRFWQCWRDTILTAGGIDWTVTEAIAAIGHCEGPLDVHEIIPRSVWPDGDLVPSNCVLVCRFHHRWIDNHPELANKIGLHKFSWERP